MRRWRWRLKWWVRGWAFSRHARPLGQGPFGFSSTEVYPWADVNPDDDWGFSWSG